MIVKCITCLGLIALLAQPGRAQGFQYTERLPQGRTYVGDNVLHLDITTVERPYSYVFPNMIARIDQRLEQFILAIPAIEPDLADLTVLDTMTPEERAFLARLVHVDRTNPIIVRLFFPPGIFDPGQLEDEPLAMAGEVQMGNRTYKTLAQVQGLHQDNQLLISFSLVIDNTLLGIPRQAIEDIQLYARGVRLAGMPGALRP